MGAGRIYDCTIGEIEDPSAHSGHGLALHDVATARILEEAWKCGFIKAVLLTLGYVTAKDRPEDITHSRGAASGF
jgi:hypothetical protein